MRNSTLPQVLIGVISLFAFTFSATAQELEVLQVVLDRHLKEGGGRMRPLRNEEALVCAETSLRGQEGRGPLSGDSLYVRRAFAELPASNESSIAIDSLRMPRGVELVRAGRCATALTDWPSRSGVLHMSRPAFVRDGSIALVRVYVDERERDRLAFHVVERIDNVWRVVDSRVTIATDW